jgi:hypothetical protein
VVHPPFIEGPVWSYIEPLFRWGCFCKSVTNVGTVDDKVLGRSNRIEQARSGLVDTVCISFVKYLDRSQSAGAVADGRCIVPSCSH